MSATQPEIRYNNAVASSKHRKKKERNGTDETEHRMPYALRPYAV